ncbi:MAG: thioredoxin domain-containing protein [Candidatus Dechloromonas phosphoritropha]|jgi:putative thioredoxin
MPHTLASRTASLIFATHLEHFDRDVIEASHTVPVMVDFRGDWCPLRRALTPVLKRVIADHFGKLKMTQVEVDKGASMKLAGCYVRRGFPSVLLFVNGEVVGRFFSVKAEHRVREFIDDHLDITCAPALPEHT